MELTAVIVGPPDTPYQGGTFIVDIQLPSDYPFSAPRYRFRTSIWHPNVHQHTGVPANGNMKWHPTMLIVK
jgi:ubiquitin-conjugating enzyme (huntingtin interacting protein 2)